MCIFIKRCGQFYSKITHAALFFKLDHKFETFHSHSTGHSVTFTPLIAPCVTICTYEINCHSLIDDIAIALPLPSTSRLVISAVSLEHQRHYHHNSVDLHIPLLYALSIIRCIDKTITTLPLLRNFCNHTRTIVIYSPPLFPYFTSHHESRLFIPTVTTCGFCESTITLPHPSQI